MRIDTSVRLMLNAISDNLSLEQIANQSGFNNLRTFYRNFSKVMNVTPAKFRKIAQDERIDAA
jgi:AraC-like DNA-binding protein